jgi:ketosteroid isomerase-like protein
MKTIARSILGLLVIWGCAVAQKASSADEAALKALEEKWDQASVKGDAAGLGTILADSFITTSPEGQVRTKNDMLSRMKSGEVKYETSKVDELKFLVYGDTAIVSGRWHGKFTEKGKAQESTERFTDTFVRQNGQWKCVASHASNIK